MRALKGLDKTWTLFECGGRKFALNSKFITCIADFKQAECLMKSVKNGIKRGIYSVYSIHVVLLDGRVIIGEDSNELIKMTFSEFINKGKNSIISTLEKIENYIVTGKHVDSNEIGLYGTSIRHWIFDEEANIELENTKIKIRNSLKDIDVNLKNVNSNLTQLKQSLEIMQNIKRIVNKIIKNLDKCIEIYNKNILESCILIKHKGITYGIIVDNIIAVTDKITVKAEHSEYKVIAGRCKYNNTEFNILNIKYTTELAKKLVDK